MIGFTVATILMTIYLTWTSIGGWAYRRPVWLLVCGLAVAFMATVTKGFPLIVKTMPNPPWSITQLEFAAALVDPTLIGLAGGLIAAAAVLKVQILHASEVSSAKRQLAQSLETMQDVERADDDLKLVARAMSNEEFDYRLNRIKEQRMDAFMDHLEAKKVLKKIIVPGLPGDE